MRSRRKMVTNLIIRPMLICYFPAISAHKLIIIIYRSSAIRIKSFIWNCLCIATKDDGNIISDMTFTIRSCHWIMLQKLKWVVLVKRLTIQQMFPLTCFVTWKIYRARYFSSFVYVLILVVQEQFFHILYLLDTVERMEKVFFVCFGVQHTKKMF